MILQKRYYNINVINGGATAKESKLKSLKNMVGNGKDIDSNDSMQLLLTQQITIFFQMLINYMTLILQRICKSQY